MKKQLRIAFLALSATAAAAFGSWFLATGGRTPDAAEPPLPVKQVTTQPVAPAPDNEPQPIDSTPVDPQAKDAQEQRLAQAGEHQAFFNRLRALYPSDYNAAIRAVLAGGGQAQDNAADLFLSEAMRQLRQTRGLLAGKAGGQALDQLFDANRNVLRELGASDAALCVDFLNGAPADRFVAFTAAHRALMAAEALAGLEAMDDGAHKKIDREAPNSQDFDDLERLLLSKGLDKAAIDLLLDGKTPNPPLTDAQACRNGLIYLDALQSLPDLQRLRLYALAVEVMAHE
ncbi:hypothetical protein [uncultured Rhodoblastus sp.]|uniref:hypothetical protein n=1 Tax=uncultured Rhodoblastus sp. TaxID=543037 RepID=UPI0025E57317|nr:hypothetical protein [uncultured Rhodoblastus sp.]